MALDCLGFFKACPPNNTLTFNPGWDENAHKVEPFDDVRKIQKELKSKGIALQTTAEERLLALTV